MIEVGKSLKYSKSNEKSSILNIHLKGKFIFIDNDNKESLFINTLGDKLTLCKVVFVEKESSTGFFGRKYYLTKKRFKQTRLKKEYSDKIDEYINNNYKNDRGVIRHSNLKGDLYEELMHESCLIFASYLNALIRENGNNGVIPYVIYGYNNGKDDSEGIGIEKGFLIHAGYKLSNGIVVDGLNMYKNTKVFSSYVQNNYDTSGTTMLLEDVNYVRKEFYTIDEQKRKYLNNQRINIFNLSDDALLHGKTLVDILNKKGYLDKQ